MKYIEFGTQNQDAVILLHGGGLSWWNCREIARLLEKLPKLRHGALSLNHPEQYARILLQMVL